MGLPRLSVGVATYVQECMWAEMVKLSVRIDSIGQTFCGSERQRRRVSPGAGEIGETFSGVVKIGQQCPREKARLMKIV